MIYACTKKLRKTSMVAPFLWLWWLNVKPYFIAFLTGKTFRPQISLKISRYGPGFQWTKCSSIFWKENQRMFDQFALSLFSAQTFLSGDLAILKNGIFWIKIFLFGFVGIANLIWFCECNKIDELNIENRIEIDRSEAKKYEYIHESCVFSFFF